MSTPEFKEALVEITRELHAQHRHLSRSQYAHFIEAMKEVCDRLYRYLPKRTDPSSYLNLTVGHFLSARMPPDIEHHRDHPAYRVFVQPLDSRTKHGLFRELASTLNERAFRAPFPSFTNTILRETPFARLLRISIPVVLPRMEHQYILAGTGHGKTTLMLRMILKDLEAVAEGQRSVVVIDSQRQMIDTIKRLKLFAPGQPLHGRLVVIDPTDVRYPVALPLFQSKQTNDDAENERLHNSVVSLLTYVFEGLLGSQLTPYQTTLLGFALRLCMVIPDATIHTLREVLRDVSPYEEHLGRLDPIGQDFFTTQYAEQRYRQSRVEVESKLFAVFNNATFTRMFSSPVPTFDMFEEMNAGKVILIDTAKDHLQQEGSRLLGRFFIALIMQAAQERFTRAKLPTHVYVDEAHEYIDQRIETMLQQARKSNIGLTLAHQSLSDLGDAQSQVLTNTAIKFAAAVNHRDATTLSHEMRTDPEDIKNQRKLAFRTHIKGQITTTCRFARKPVDEAERMTDDEWRQVQDEMRARYAASPPSAPSSRSVAASHAAEEDETAPTDW